MRLRPRWKDHVWAYDFVTVWTHDGRVVRMLTVLDEYTRECLSIVVVNHPGSVELQSRIWYAVRYFFFFWKTRCRPAYRMWAG